MRERASEREREDEDKVAPPTEFESAVQGDRSESVVPVVQVPVGIIDTSECESYL